MNAENYLQREYKRRHGKVGRIIQWKLRDKFNLEKSKNWYLHNHQTVTENFNHKLLWDMYIQHDNIIVERRPDIVTVKKMLEDSKIIDLAIPGDKRIINKEKDKTEMYWNLKIEILRLWNL